MSEREDAVRQMIEDATRDFFDRYDVLYKEQYDRAEAAEREASELREELAKRDTAISAYSRTVGEKTREAIELRERNEKLTEAIEAVHPAGVSPAHELGDLPELCAVCAALSTGEAE